MVCKKLVHQIGPFTPAKSPQVSVIPNMGANSFSWLVRNHWCDFASRFDNPRKISKLNGRNLTIAAVVHTARHGGIVTLDPAVLPTIGHSSEILRESVKKGEVIYGVNTGYGGSADTRTRDVIGLQQSLLRMLQYGIIANNQVAASSTRVCDNGHASSDVLHSSPASIGPTSSNHDMPRAWVRATMAVRINSLAGGASGIEASTLQVLIDLLSADIVPQIPLRGSISASGDLSSLSYIAGVMQGDHALRAYVDGALVPSDEALVAKGIRPAVLGPKEGLAIVNGTAASAAVGCLAIHEILQLATMAQVLTAMSVEALLGSEESFDPFVAVTRPHIGQTDAAENIRGFLRDSKLLSKNYVASQTLRQDRYSLRTSTQWIGPVLEDIQLSVSQVSTEINSVTDNPLIDVENQRHVHGGNFQARSIASAMEKVRLCCQTIGKMLFAQCTEMINPMYNRGLPPNLTINEPSKSFLFKGVDIMVAALSSELGHLSAPVNHIESAEMGNQSLNSLALISGRYTLEGIDVLSQLVAAHLAAVCQALDLRVLQMRWMKKIVPTFKEMVRSLLAANDTTCSEVDASLHKAWSTFCRSLDSSTTMDSADRIKVAVNSTTSIIMENTTAPLLTIKNTLSDFSCFAHSTFIDNRDDYVSRPDATSMLGSASKRIYLFVRKHLDVPFVTEEVLEESKACFGTVVQSRIYAAVRNGMFWPVLMECIEDKKNSHNDCGATRSHL